MSSAPDQVAAGRAAWHRLRERERTTWQDWTAVANALVIGRSAALKAAGTNRAVGSRYNTAMGSWLRKHGLDGITNQERYRALLVLENLPAISAWRDGLAEARRRSLNHPGAVWAAWRRATTSAATQPRQRVVKVTTPTTPRGYGRAVHWPSDALRRAATAIREASSTDTFVLARRALEAAIRSEDDLLALLPPAARRSSVSSSENGLPSERTSAHAHA